MNMDIEIFAGQRLKLPLIEYPSLCLLFKK